MGACASAVSAVQGKGAGAPKASSQKSSSNPLEDALKTLTGLIGEIQKMGVTCFPAANLAMALPAYIWDLEAAKQFDYSKPSKKGIQPKVDYSDNDKAMAILALLAYEDGAAGKIQQLLFKSATSPTCLGGKNPGAELVQKGVTLSEASYAQTPSYESAKGKPCWFCVADEQKKVVYVVVRGTQNAGDILSDLNIQTKDIVVSGKSAKVHSGIQESAEFVIQSTKDHIAPYLEKGFSLVFTGHSLGAGTAALATAHVRSNFGGQYKEATAVTFACPGIVAAKNDDGSKSELSKAMKTYVTTYILGYDVVPRAAGVAVFTLLDNIFSNNWEEKTKKKIEEEAKKKLGAAGGMMGNMAKMAAAAAPKPTAAELAAEAAKKKKIADDVAEGRRKISTYPHILPGGSLRHMIKNPDAKTGSTFRTKKKLFHEVIMSAKDPSAFMNNHKMGEYIDFLQV